MTWFGDEPKGAGPADDALKINVVVGSAGSTPDGASVIDGGSSTGDGGVVDGPNQDGGQGQGGGNGQGGGAMGSGSSGPGCSMTGVASGGAGLGLFSLLLLLGALALRRSLRHAMR